MGVRGLVVCILCLPCSIYIISSSFLSLTFGSCLNVHSSRCFLWGSIWLVADGWFGYELLRCFVPFACFWRFAMMGTDIM